MSTTAAWHLRSPLYAERGATRQKNANPGKCSALGRLVSFGRVFATAAPGLWRTLTDKLALPTSLLHMPDSESITGNELCDWYDLNCFGRFSREGAR